MFNKVYTFYINGFTWLFVITDFFFLLFVTNSKSCLSLTYTLYCISFMLYPSYQRQWKFMFLKMNLLKGTN